jgi:signal transduction histidine kinase
LTVVADRNALKQVLLTLLDNAIVHAEGVITLVARADLRHQDSQLAIDIHDSGPGIDDETRARLFERFSRGHAARGKPGLGLGLPIARALAEAQKGTLTVESQVGEGTTFTITLPLYRDPIEDE